MSLDQIKAYGMQIINILESIHQQGIIHRDIKFENFMLDKHLNLKLIDFGTAKLMKDNKNAQMFQKLIDDQVRQFLLEYKKKNKKSISYDTEQQEVGTKYYLPPEFIEYRECSFMWDYWSFGFMNRSDDV